MKKENLTFKEIEENADIKKLDLKNTKCNFDIYFKQNKIDNLFLSLEFCHKRWHADKIKYIKNEIEKELKNSTFNEDPELTEYETKIKITGVYNKEKTENEEFEEILEAYQYFRGENI